jgi:hypothetical protein
VCADTTELDASGALKLGPDAGSGGAGGGGTGGTRGGGDDAGSAAGGALGQADGGAAGMNTGGTAGAGAASGAGGSKAGSATVGGAASAGAAGEGDSSGGAAGDTSGGGCTDTQGDPHNCGVCGHDCLGGSCSLGQCQPIQIVTETYGGHSIAQIQVGANDVYWMSNLRTRKVGKSGGLAATVYDFAAAGYASAGGGSDTQPVLKGWVVVEPNLYFTYAVGAPGSETDTLAFVPIAGGTVAPVGSRTNGACASSPDFYDLCSDGSSLFYLDACAGTNILTTLVGTTATPLSSLVGSPAAFRFDAANFYYDDGSSQTGIYATPKSGGPLTSLAKPSPLEAGSFASNGQSLYWVQDDASASSGCNIARTAVAGGATTVVLPSSPTRMELVADSSDLYFMVLSGSSAWPGMINKLAKNGGTSTVMVATPPSTTFAPSDLTQDETALYFGQYQREGFYRLAK